MLTVLSVGMFFLGTCRTLSLALTKVKRRLIPCADDGQDSAYFTGLLSGGPSSAVYIDCLCIISCFDHSETLLWTYTFSYRRLFPRDHFDDPFYCFAVCALKICGYGLRVLASRCLCRVWNYGYGAGFDPRGWHVWERRRCCNVDQSD